MNHSIRGFTMLELTLVGIIITILIAIALPNFLEAQIRAQVTAASTDMAMLSQALEEYFINYRVYPPNRVERLPEGGLDGDEDPAGRGLSLLALTTPVAYLSSLPRDQFGLDQKPLERFDFVNFVDWQGKPESQSHFGSNGSCAYLIASVAPDNLPQHMAGKVPASGLPYSPTNGTRSTGDLFLLGP